MPVARREPIYKTTSDAVRERQRREAEAARMRARRAAEHERADFADKLAHAHAERTGKPLAIAKRDVERLAISLQPKPQMDDGRGWRTTPWHL